MSRRSAMAEAGKAFGIVANFFGAILVFGGVGYALDWWRHTGYLFTLIGLGVGLVVGFITFFREALRMGK